MSDLIVCKNFHTLIHIIRINLNHIFFQFFQRLYYSCKNPVKQKQGYYKSNCHSQDHYPTDCHCFCHHRLVRNHTYQSPPCCFHIGSGYQIFLSSVVQPETALLRFPKCCIQLLTVFLLIKSEAFSSILLLINQLALIIYNTYKILLFFLKRITDLRDLIHIQIDQDHTSEGSVFITLDFPAQ